MSSYNYLKCTRLCIDSSDKFTDAPEDSFLHDSRRNTLLGAKTLFRSRFRSIMKGKDQSYLPFRSLCNRCLQIAADDRCQTYRLVRERSKIISRKLSLPRCDIRDCFLKREIL